MSELRVQGGSQRGGDSAWDKGKGACVWAKRTPSLQENGDNDTKCEYRGRKKRALDRGQKGPEKGGGEKKPKNAVRKGGGCLNVHGTGTIQGTGGYHGTQAQTEDRIYLHSKRAPGDGIQRNGKKRPIGWRNGLFEGKPQALIGPDDQKWAGNTETSCRASRGEL